MSKNACQNLKESNSGFISISHARIIVERMMKKDAVAQMLNMQLIDAKEGFCVTQMRVTKSLLNIHQTLHGGMCFSFAGSTCAFACNTYNHKTVVSQANIDYPMPAYEDDLLTATCHQIYQKRIRGLYCVEVKNTKGHMIGLFHATSHRLDKTIYPDLNSN